LQILVSKVQNWRLFDGWPGETGKASDRTFRCNYEFTERQTLSLGSGSHSTTFIDAPDNQRSSDEWSRMQRFVRRWIPHDLSEINQRERVLKANLPLEGLRADEGNKFANTMTGYESWFCFSYESDSMFVTLTFNFRLGHFWRPAAGLPWLDGEIKLGGWARCCLLSRVKH
jgi:hypothetical protein